MKRLWNGLAVTTALAASILAAMPASAQSSWWDKNMTPTQSGAGNAPANAAPTVGYRSAALHPLIVLPPLFGAVRLIGPNGRLIAANVVGRSADGGTYLVQTRRGTQIVGVYEIIDPLVGNYPCHDRQDFRSNPFRDRLLY